ncbi:MAG: hypothetical protein GXP42_01995 [Chloroflexi bacterium]|nr:hypothetical protein [Chloroflexota bacterium]
MAVVLGAFAMLLVMQSAGGGIVVQLWPVVLLIVGVFLLARAIFSRGPTVPSQPVPIDVIEPEEVEADADVDAEPAQIIPPEQPVPSPSPTPAAIPAEPQPLPPQPDATEEDETAERWDDG